jgi:PhnB protein
VAGLTPYLLFPGHAREALQFYADIFGGSTVLHTFAEFGRDDGPPDAVAHGYLADAPVSLYAADAAGEEQPFRAEGLMLSLLGTAEPATLHRWFDTLAVGGTVLDQLQERGWKAYDGQVIDRFGLRWLIGYQLESND